SSDLLVSVAIAAPNFTAGLYAVLGVLIGGGASFLFLKVFKKRNMWNRLTLKDRLTEEAGYSSMNESYASLIGKEGVTLNVMRPVGTVKIENQHYSAVSNAQWLEKDTPIKVVDVDRSEEHTSELQSRFDLVCRLLLEAVIPNQVVHSFPTRRSSDLNRGSWVQFHE